MRRLDKLVAFKVRPFDSFGPIAMHDAIEHHIATRQIRDRFKDGGVLLFEGQGMLSCVESLVISHSLGSKLYERMTNYE